MDSEWNIQDKFVYVTMNEYNIYIYIYTIHVHNLIDGDAALVQ